MQESLLGRYPRESRVLLVLTVLAGLLLGAGLVLPVITLEKFLVVTNTFSIVSGTWHLLEQGQIVLFVLIATFSIVLPVLKLAVLLRVLAGTRQSAALHRALEWIHRFGRWSMLDVFVVALMVVTVKLGAIADVTAHYGLYAFAGAVLLTMIVTARVVQLVDRLFAAGANRER
jgi:paraquat-inducible protein A